MSVRSEDEEEMSTLSYDIQIIPLMASIIRNLE